MGIKQLNLFTKQITKEKDGTPDRVHIWKKDFKEIQVGQKVMAQSYWGKLKMGIVVKINKNSIDVELLNGKTIKNANQGFFYPKEKDLDLDKFYKEAIKLFRKSKYDKLSNRHKLALVYNVPISVLVEIDNLNQKRQGTLMRLEVNLRKRVEDYLTNMLPNELCYFGGKIGKFNYKIGDKVIADRYECVYVGEIVERSPSEWYEVKSSYHYQKSDISKKIERSENIPCQPNRLKPYSILNLKKELEKNKRR